MSRTPMILALAAQLMAGLIVFGGAALLMSTVNFTIPQAVLLAGLLAGQGVLAAILGTRLGLAPWWAAINLVLPGALSVVWLWHVPAWVFLAAFILLLLVFWNAAFGGVPLYLSNNKTKAAINGLLPEKPGLRFVDLGCGMGGPVLYLAARRPDGIFTGIETAPGMFVLSWLRWRLGGLKNAEILFTNIRGHDLGRYDVVYCFLSPVPMPWLFEKARREMKAGSLFISNSFEVPDIPPDEIIVVDDRRATKLFLWRF